MPCGVAWLGDKNCRISFATLHLQYTHTPTHSLTHTHRVELSKAGTCAAAMCNTFAAPGRGNNYLNVVVVQAGQKLLLHVADFLLQDVF